MKTSPLFSACVLWSFILSISAQASGSPPYLLGISRVRASKDPNEARALERFEKGLLRALENTPELGVRVRSLGISGISREDSERLRKIQELAVRIVKDAERSEGLVASVEKVLSESPPHPEDAPWVQSTRLAQSIVFWRKGAFKEANRYLDLAQRLHPHGAIDESLDLLLAGGEATRFRAWVAQSQKPEVFECSLDLSIVPSDASVALNGFQMGARRHFELVGGTRYHILAGAVGYLPKELIFECSGAGQWIESLQLVPGAGFGPSDLLPVSRYARSSGVNSLILVDSDRLGTLRLFLYTSGVGLEPIFLEAPLTLANLDHPITEDKPPVPLGPFFELLQNHRKLPLRAGLVLRGEGASPLSGKTEFSDRGKSADWYEKKEFWWVVGSLGVAVLTGFIVSRRPNGPVGGLQGAVE